MTEQKEYSVLEMERQAILNKGIRVGENITFLLDHRNKDFNEVSGLVKSVRDGWVALQMQGDYDKELQLFEWSINLKYVIAFIRYQGEATYETKKGTTAYKTT